MNRRDFFVSSSAFALGAAHASPLFALTQAQSAVSSALSWKAASLDWSFTVVNGHLRQHNLLPENFGGTANRGADGPETGLRLSGENASDAALKQSGGTAGHALVFQDHREEKTANGSTFILTHRDTEAALEVESLYQSFDQVPFVIRRSTRIKNVWDKPVGIEYLSSAMLHGLADSQRFDHELKIHLAFNSWMSEGQWHILRPSQLGWVENERTSWSEAEATSIGSWSTEKYLPMAVVENPGLGVSWFWQIEHNGSWHWEVSNASSGGNQAGDVYAYLGGPDGLHHQAWKNIQPGQSYETVPVAVGCVPGGFEAAIGALTTYRRRACIRPRPQEPSPNAVIFNDYMNCLSGDPTEAKEPPLIEAAAKAGCEYFVIDAGWYAEANEDWGSTVGAWQPSKTRWPRGLKFTLDAIRSHGMVPGLWLEPEVAGLKSPLAPKPDSWFLMRHGRRHVNNGRLFLDFRNPEVRAYLDGVVDRLVNDYGMGYIKMDYNADTLEGTDQNSDSLGQGLLEHNRAHLAWLSGLLDRHPKLVIENCGSGGGREDYAMLSRLQLQSGSDQEDYRCFPAIVTGSTAAVLPEQLAIWSYPILGATADAASFNMVNAMLTRIHQSGNLAQLEPAAADQVIEGIRVYKTEIRPLLTQFLPFYPLGMPDLTDRVSPVALGMKTASKKFVSVWRLKGESEIVLPNLSKKTRLLYPSGLGIELTTRDNAVSVHLPRPFMAAILVDDNPSA